MRYQQKILTLFGTTGDSEQFGKTRLTIAGNTINEINKALKDLGAQKIDFTTDGLSTNLGHAKTDINAIFKLITQGSTETNAQLQVDLAAIQKYMDKVADKGPQKALQQFDKIMANASAQAKVYVQQTDSAALSTTAFAESQQRLAKISNTVIGGLKGIGASLLSMGVTLAVSAALNAVVKAIYNAATAEKRYREAALDSATAVNERIQDTQSYIDQIKELREALDDGNLTENEAYETRKKLIGVQDELSGKYGDELKGIDLVNGGLEKQIGLLDEAAKKKANAFLTETDKDSENNKRAIETAQRNMSRFDTYGSSVNNLTASDLQILKKYAAANGFKQNTYKNSNGEKFSIDIAFQGDASGAEKAYNDFLTDVQNDKTLSQNIKDSITEQGKAWLQNIQEISSANEELAQQAAKYQIQTTTAYNELYENLAQAQKDYNEAVAKDDDIAIKKAVEDGKNAIGAIRSAAFNQSENDYHTDLSDALGEGAENSPVWQALNEQLTDLKEKLKETFSSADASQINQSIEEIIDEATKANGVLTESQTDTIRATGRAQNLYDLAKAQEELTEKQKEYNEALNSQSSYDADGNGKDNLDKLTAELQQAQDKVTELTQKKEQLKDPTPLEISTFALDYAQGRIDGVEHTAKETTQMLSDIGLTVDASQAQSEIDEQNQKAEQFTKTLSNVPVTLDTSTCQTKIANVSKAIDGLKREVPITLNFGVAGTVLSVFSGGLTVSGSKSKSSKSSTNTGTAAGTPNSHGGKTLVGEIGNELVVNPHTGKWYTVGDNGAEFVNLPHGAIVFNHEKTQRLLKNGFVGGYGDALVSGNAMDAGSPGVGSFVGTAGNNYMPGKNPLVKNTYKATKASTKATKENSKALEENKKALEKQKTALEKQKTALEKESNKLKIYGQAAIDEIEKREKALNKEKEAQDKAFEAEIDHLNEIKDAKDKELDAETKRIKEEKDAKDKAWEKEKKQLEEKKEALQDANDEEDRAIKLAELKDALAKAQANRTVRIYNRNQGFIWAADQEAVNDAQTALDDQMRDWKRDDVIKAVENEIDAIDKLKDAYDEETDNRLDDIDKEKEAFDEKIEAEIEDINKRKDAYDKAIEAEIEKLDDVKEKWNEAMSLIGTSWEDYQLQLAAAAHFTDMSLDGMSGEISGYKDDVLANMKEIGGVTDQIDSITESIEKLEEAISNARDAASGGGGGSSGTTDYSSLFPTGDGSDVDTGNDDSSSDGIVSKLENQRNAVENLRAAVEAASAQNKEYTKTEQELSKTLEDGNLVGAQRAGIMQEYTAAQGNTRQSFDLLIQKSKEYTQAIIDEKDISQGARDAEVASLAYLLERHVGTSDTITQILSDYATALTENTSITGEQYQNSIDMLLGVSDQAQLSGDQMQTVLGATTYAVASSTQMDNEQRQAQMDSIIALAQQHGASTEEIIGYLVNADIKMEESGVKTKDAHEKISAAVKDACKSLCLDYNTVIQKVDEAIAAYKREQEEISKLVQARKQASVIANGFSVNGGGGSLATQRVARYATGVLNAATTHIAITDEKGPEIKMRKPSFGQYSLIEKGSSVIPAQPSANLWKFGLDPESFIASHMNQRSIKSVEITQPNMSSAPVVNVGDIQMYGVNDPDSFARVLHDRVGGIFAQEFSKR